jgi:uncharacterized membrane protein
MWFIFALFTAFFESIKDVFSKKGLLKNFDEYLTAWALRFYALPIFFILLLFYELPKIGSQFYLALFVSGTLNLIALIFYMKAIKYSDISLAVPLLTFTPLFLLLTSPLIIGEFPKIFGVIGVILIVIGSYLLNIQARKNSFLGFFYPFRALLKEKGPKFMLATALIWSISSNVDKIGVINSSPAYWALAVNLFIAFFMTIIVCYRQRGKGYNKLFKLKSLLPIGVFSGLSYSCQSIAYSLTLVTNVISIKRTSVLFSVIFGYWIFKEKNIKERLFGAIIMIIGVLLITLL